MIQNDMFACNQQEILRQVTEERDRYKEALERISSYTEIPSQRLAIQFQELAEMTLKTYRAEH